MRLRAVATGIVLLAMAVPVLLAFAEHRGVRDANDVDGLLDLRRISIYGRPRVWNMRTHNAWSSRSIWDRGYLLVQLDTLAGPRFDYFALVFSKGASMRGALFRDRARKSDYRVAGLQTWRVNRRGVKVRIPLGKMRVAKGRGFFRWKTRTLFTGRGCRRTCIDIAPVGAVEEPLAPQPSPSPSPSG